MRNIPTPAWPSEQALRVIHPNDNRWAANDPNRPLTIQQHLLVREFMRDCIFSAAMIRAGYKDTSNADRLKKRPNISKAIKRSLLERRDACITTADAILGKLVQMTDVTIDDFIDWRGDSIELKALADINPQDLAMVKAIKQGKNSSWTLKLHDKLVVIEKIMRHLGML
ncbi:MAG: terminase small subunit [Humidesulfovibrio sp.]|nr:terminase small subunit [Humidesulfovibrio sp.]